MKASRFILIGLLVLVCNGLNAQFFIGGRVGISASGSKTGDGSETTQGPSTFSFNVMPSIGKFLSDNVALGCALSYSFSQSKTHGLTETVSKSNNAGITPFLRYYPVKVSKFSVFGQANVGVTFGSSSTEVGTQTSNGPKNTDFGISISPGLAYDITDKIALETTLGFLSASYTYSNSKSGSDKSSSSSFNFGAGTANIINVGDITVGAIVKF